MDDKDGIALIGSVAASAGSTAGAREMFGVTVAGSNAATVHDLHGPFAEQHVGGGAGIAADVSAFEGTSDTGQKITGGAITIGEGVGASIGTGLSGTAVKKIGNMPSGPHPSGVKKSPKANGGSSPSRPSSQSRPVAQQKPGLGFATASTTTGTPHLCTGSLIGITGPCP